MKDDPDVEYPFLNRTTKKLPVIRYCLKCDAMKPPRVHHCSVCGICVAKVRQHSQYGLILLEQGLTVL